MAIGFLKPHIAGTTEKIVMAITITDQTYDPTGAVAVFKMAPKDAVSAAYSVNGTLTQSGSSWTASWEIPEDATQGLTPGLYQYQAFLDKDGDERAIDAGSLVVRAHL